MTSSKSSIVRSPAAYHPSSSPLTNGVTQLTPELALPSYTDALQQTKKLIRNSFHHQARDSNIQLLAGVNSWNSHGSQTNLLRASNESQEDLESRANPPLCQIEYIDSSSSSILSAKKKLPEPPYHVLTRTKKKKLVYIVSLAGLFSPLSSNIYFPALGQVATVRLEQVPSHKFQPG
jgi:hypothetical protein